MILTIKITLTNNNKNNKMQRQIKNTHNSQHRASCDIKWWPKDFKQYQKEPPSYAARALYMPLKWLIHH